MSTDWKKREAKKRRMELGYARERLMRLLRMDWTKLDPETAARRQDDSYREAWLCARRAHQLGECR